MDNNGAGIRKPMAIRKCKLCSIVRVRYSKEGELEKVCAAGFSAHVRWNEMSIWNHAKTVIQSMIGFSRCKVAA